MTPLLRALAVLLSTTALLLAGACGDDGDDPAPAGTPADQATEPAPGATDEPSAGGGLSLTSSAFGDNETIPVQYTCDGDNMNPPLTIAGTPNGTESLALIVDDIDGPDGSFIHWTVFNIDPATTDVAGASVPGGGTEGQTSLGDGGYFGPCPPTGVHRYVFQLYALDTVLELDASAGRGEIEAAMAGHIIEETQLTGTYSRAADSAG